MKILIPLPEDGFDPTEAAIPWKLATEAGHEVAFATPHATVARADPRMLDGRGLGPWKRILAARHDACEAYGSMIQSAAFQAPRAYSGVGELEPELDGLLLPGGHAPGMRVYLEAPELQQLALAMMRADAAVGAICHGVLLLARSTDPDAGRSVLHGRKTTALLQRLEMTAWWMTRAWLGDYYRTYRESVQSEVTRALASADDFLEGPRGARRDTPGAPGFAVRDGRYVSARWPGDVYAFSQTFLDVLELSKHAARR